MNFKDKYEISDDFASLFDFKSDKDELKHDAYVLMFKFLSEISKLNENDLQNKDLAIALDKSRSFISQLFKGNKLANLLTLAKLQKSYDLTFQVRAIPNKSKSLLVSDEAIFANEYQSPKDNFDDYDPKLTFVFGGNKKEKVLQQAYKII